MSEKSPNRKLAQNYSPEVGLSPVIAVGPGEVTRDSDYWPYTALWEVSAHLDHLVAFIAF